jgi:hypothetical protein
VRSTVVVVASIVATIAFAAYARTLLPGVDLGDTGGFQAAVLWPEISARQAYPLYYALAKPFVASVGSANPARGLNLFSALNAAVAVGILAAITAHISGSLAAGAFAGLLLAFSYTFWTQAVIAEVYALHLALVGACLLALAAYERTPTVPRLALFFGVYALSFGNHLSMILLLVPFAVFLLMSAPQPSMLLRPRIVALAVLSACVGALQYVPNLMAVWTAADAPPEWTARLGAFWFDVTKADWRESMVLGITPSDVPGRIGLFLFDARQQFGYVGLLIAVLGAVALWRMSRPWAVLVILSYIINTAFAFSYNVGDPHAFFLPGHYFIALAAGCFIGAATYAARPVAVAATVIALLFVALRGYDTWPATDRHADRRAAQTVQRLTIGVDDRTALLVTALNWQVENALLYETRYGSARNIVWTRLSDVFLHFPLLVNDNHASGRDVVLTARAAAEVVGAFGSLLPVDPDPMVPTPTLESTVARVPRGAPYVLAILPPPRDEVVDSQVLEATIRTLTGGATPARASAPFEVIAGHAGDRPTYYRSSAEPFRDEVPLPEGTLDIRMESWVSLETFRRGGFGHVLLDRKRLMFVERGISLVWVNANGTAELFYAAGLYAPRPRFRISVPAVPRHALLH